MQFFFVSFLVSVLVFFSIAFHLVIALLTLLNFFVLCFSFLRVVTLRSLKLRENIAIGIKDHYGDRRGIIVKRGTEAKKIKSNREQ